jgi:hypothetical protein
VLYQIELRPVREREMGFEPTTFGLEGRRSTIELHPHYAGGRNRTRDPLITNQKLYQLSYASLVVHLFGWDWDSRTHDVLDGLKPPLVIRSLLSQPFRDIHRDLSPKLVLGRASVEGRPQPEDK